MTETTKLPEGIQHLITVEEEGRKIADLLRNRLGFSRSLIRKLKREGGVYLNGNPVPLVARVSCGDTLQIHTDPPEESEVLPEAIPLDIVMEDEDVIVINKPPGMLVHPLTGEPRGTLANAVLHHWLQRGKRSRFRPVHRIDRDTSGLVLVAGNRYAHLHLTRQLKDNRLLREYIAVVHGSVPVDTGSITAPIQRRENSIIERSVGAAGKPAVTRFKVLKRLARGTVVALQLETGRTHQIRVHMSYIGHPLWGDTLYGGSAAIINRQALHASTLKFEHPITGKELTVTCTLPRDMEILIQKLST